MSLAWHTAALYRSKRMPKLQKLLAKVTSQQRRQSWREQMAVMDQWVAHTQRRAKLHQAGKTK